MRSPLRRSPAGRVIANARVRPIVEFGGDPYAEGRQRALTGEIASRLQGLGGHPYVGDRGDPNQAFYGTVTGGPQAFVTAAPVVGIRPSTAAAVDAAPTIETGAGDNPYADPAARIFAQRMARRR